MAKFIPEIYYVATHFLPALANGDYSGLEPQDEQELNEFTETNELYDSEGHFDFDESEDSKEVGDCEVCFQTADVVQVKFMRRTDDDSTDERVVELDEEGDE